MHSRDVNVEIWHGKAHCTTVNSAMSAATPPVGTDRVVGTLMVPCHGAAFLWGIVTQASAPCSKCMQRKCCAAEQVIP